MCGPKPVTEVSRAMSGIDGSAMEGLEFILRAGKDLSGV